MSNALPMAHLRFKSLDCILSGSTYLQTFLHRLLCFMKYLNGTIGHHIEVVLVNIQLVALHRKM